MIPRIGVGSFIEPAFIAADCAYRILADTHSILIIGECKILFGVIHIVELSAVPGHVITAVGEGVPNFIVGYGFSIIAYKQVLPFTVIRIGIGVSRIAR